MKTNSQLQQDVQNAIKWEPLLHAAEIGVTAQDGIVTLSGVVDNYFKKTEAQHAALKVLGVKALVEHIEVRFPSDWSKTDVQLAIEVLAAFKNKYSIPEDKIDIEVKDGWVTLSGELPWNYQRISAENAVKHLEGVKGVHNNITIKSEIDDAIEKKAVEAAIARHWSLDSSNVDVTVHGTTVTLSGTVDSGYQRSEIGRITWNTPGIWHVNNELEVDFDYDFG